MGAKRGCKFHTNPREGIVKRFRFTPCLIVASPRSVPPAQPVGLGAGDCAAEKAQPQVARYDALLVVETDARLRANFSYAERLLVPERRSSAVSQWGEQSRS